MLPIAIVGSGFTGCTAARLLADHGYKVHLYERRSHLGGNAADHFTNGLPVSLYGPHLFHTNSQYVFDFLSRFTAWMKYEHHVKAKVEGLENLIPLPLTPTTLYLVSEGTLPTEYVDPIDSDAEGYLTKKFGQLVTDRLFRGYTEKQWHRPLSQVPSSVVRRIPVRNSDDYRYFSDRFQFLPSLGYTRMFESMVKHPLIRVLLDEEFDPSLTQTTKLYSGILYTGGIDTFYRSKLGSLEYLSLEFQYDEYMSGSDPSSLNEIVVNSGVGTVNFPSSNTTFTRSSDYSFIWSKARGQPVPVNRLICSERPLQKGEPYYPLPDKNNLSLYKEYVDMHEAIKTPTKVWFAGRLGSYQYLNMDQACAQGMSMAKTIMRETPLC